MDDEDDEDDGSVVDGTTTDEDSSDSGIDPWDSTMFPSDSRDESDGEDDERGDSSDDTWGDSGDDRWEDGEGDEREGEEREEDEREEDDEDGEGDDEDGEGDDEDGEGNVAGALAPEVPVEPGRPDPANVVFVVLGAYLGVMAVASLLGAGGSFTLVEYAAVTVGFLALSGLVYGFLTRNNPDT